MDDERDDLLQEKLDQMNPQRFERDRFLDTISQIESSGGKNFNHTPVQTGIQAGQTAAGNFGLMPNTIEELNKRAQMGNTLTPEMQAMGGRDPASIKQTLESDPKLEREYANQLASHVLGKFQDPAMAAYAWNQGHNLTPKAVKSRHYEDSPYVQKFNKIWKSLGTKK